MLEFFIRIKSGIFFSLLLCLFIASGFFLTKFSWAANLFSDDFESGLISWTSTSTYSGSGTATAVDSTDEHYAGNYSGKFEVTDGSSGGWALVRKTVAWPAENKLWYSCYFKISNYTVANLGGIYLLEPYVEGAFYHQRADIEIIYNDPDAILEEGQIMDATKIRMRLAYTGKDGSREGHRQKVNLQAVTFDNWHKVTMLIDLSGVNPVYAWWLNNHFVWQDTDTSSGSDTDVPTHLYAGITNIDYGNGNKARVWMDNCSIDTTGPVAGFDIDESAPLISLDPVMDPTNDDTPLITGTVTDTLSTITAVEFQIDGTEGLWTACTTNDENFDEASENFTCASSSLADGNHTMFLRAIDANNNTTVADNYTSITFTVDTAEPTVNSITITPATTSAIVSWITTESSSSKVDYGLTTSYGSSTLELDTSPRVTSHMVSFSGLIPCATYHYRVRSKDAANNEKIDSDRTFTTTGCTGSATVNSQTTSAVTTASGGVVELLSGSYGLSLIVPTSFSSSDANFQIKSLETNSVLDITSSPETYSLVGSYLYDLKALSEVGIAISSFSKPLTVTIAYSASDITGLSENSLTIHRWDGSTWHALTDCSVDTSVKTVTCLTSAFSVFGLFGQSSSDSSSSSSSSSNNSSLPSAKSCGKMLAGGKIPWLYGAISQNDNSILLFFTPGDEAIDKYVLEYGTSSGFYQYGVSDMGINSRSQMSYLVKSLSPSTTYYFRLRGGQGCLVGDWSNEISATTKKDLKSDFETPNIKLTAVKHESSSFSNSATSSLSPKNQSYVLNVLVVDQKHKPISGAKVFLLSQGQTNISDKDGKTLFVNVPAGKQKIAVNYATYKAEKIVDLRGEKKEFNLEMIIKKTDINLNPFAIGGITVGVTILIVILMVKFGAPAWI